MSRIPTAPIAAASLIAAYGLVLLSGSRPLGGLLLGLGGLCCIALWRGRHGTRRALELAATGLGAFVASHLLALAIGAWPAVLVTAGILAAVTWRYADTRVHYDGRSV